ncbi:MAG: hypothetical protein KIT09_16845 [Bryobacteraceae bacterium]|nr:hypothetical protein [Bryobacteraceae bacterium]
MRLFLSPPCVALCAAAVLVLSCRAAPEQAAQEVVREAARDPFAEPAPQGREADDAARFVAGLPGNPGSAFAELERLPPWEEHRRALDAAWKRTETKALAFMREFQRTELDPMPAGAGVTFYPFSGPDALTMTVFFPQSPTYLMVGLEPAGTLPTSRQFDEKRLTEELAALRGTVHSELRRSFFVTREMDRQFRGQVTDGLLPAILHLLARTGHTILGYRYVRLDEKGNIIGREAGYRAPGKIGNKGVQVDFRAGEGAARRLYYFSVNLSDKSLEKNRPFLAFLENLKGVTTLLKATSYMTHQDGFSAIRGEILARSAAVLQDDSGIPYRFFAPGAWRVQVYGEYSRPYGSFRWLKQADLKAAYASPGRKPLKFAIGYGYSRAPSNLLLAKRAAGKAQQ